MIGEFENADLHWNTRVDTRHHDQAASVQISFAKDVRSLVTVIEELGDPFEEESQDLLVLDTKEIADPTVVETVRSVKRIGQEQFDAFTKECLIDRTKSIHETIHRNKLPLFGLSSRVVMSGVKHLSHSLCFLLQVAGGGSRLMMDYMNHIGPHFRKHPRRATS